MKQQVEKLDVICIGRVAVDFYGQQIGARLEDMGSFAKYLGGSSGNVAYGTAVQGLKSAMLARVGDEHMGRFLRETLLNVGVNVEYLITDKQRLTALVVLGIKDQETFPLIFYRDQCADMALSEEDIDEAYIARARALAITGTHLSHVNTRQAVLKALRLARKHGLKTALDIDYRPVLWGLTSLGDGETRYVESDKVTQQLQEVLHHFDLIVGTEEEFHIAGGVTETLAALKKVREITPATLVCKRGALGCVVFEGAIPDHWDEVKMHSGVQVEVLNVLGAGDAFMSGLLCGWLNNEGWQQACRYANACGALVVSRHGCSSAMPTQAELDYYLQHENEILRPDQDVMLNHLHRVTTRKTQWENLCIFAFDHRMQLEEMAREAGVGTQRIRLLKQRLFKAAQLAAQDAQLTHQAGILADTTYGQAVLNAATGADWWIARPVEKPGARPLRFEHGEVGKQLVEWPLEQIVKCLVFYHPHDAEQMRAEQDRSVLDLWQSCCRFGHELLLEVILPKDQPDHQDRYYLEVMQHFYTLGIRPDWWKLPPLAKETWQQVERLIDQFDPYCRGVLLLGLDAPHEQLKAGFAAAAQANCVKGFAVGRTIFAQPARLWLKGEIDDAVLIEQVKHNYMTLIGYWQTCRANTPTLV